MLMFINKPQNVCFLLSYPINIFVPFKYSRIVNGSNNFLVGILSVCVYVYHIHNTINENTS